MARNLLITLCALGGILLGLGILGFVKRDGIAHRFHEWRSASLLEDSLAASTEGEWEEAERLAMAAWQLREGDIAVLRQWFAAARQDRSRNLLVTSRLS